MKKQTPKLFILIFFVALFQIAFFSFPAEAQTTSITSLAEQKATNEKLKLLEEKAEMYRKLIEIKVKEQNNLENQIAIAEAEISQVENEILIKKGEIEELNDQINRLTRQIEEQEKSIASQRKILGNLIQVYFETKKQDLLSNFIGKEKIYSFMAKNDNLIQTQDKLKEIINNIESMKRQLEEERTSLEKKKKTATDLSLELEEKYSLLESRKAQKEVLIQETEGEENKYQKLLSKVESQKADLLNIDELSIASGLSAAKYAKPTSGIASTSWYYSQKDSRWGNDSIGNSRSLMKDWGCAVTSVAMVFSYYGGSVTPEELARRSAYFYWDLIKWPETWSNPSLKLSSYGKAHGNIDWAVIDSEIRKNNPVIVYIKKKNGGGGHYVVIHHKLSNGKYVVHDPYFGPNIYLDTSRALVGQMGSSSDTTIDQMIIYRK